MVNKEIVCDLKNKGWRLTRRTNEEQSKHSSMHKLVIEAHHCIYKESNNHIGAQTLTAGPY